MNLMTLAQLTTLNSSIIQNSKHKPHRLKYKRIKRTLSQTLFIKTNPQGNVNLRIEKLHSLILTQEEE